jgi:4,5-DOPA dioxygenase extradiol
MHRKNFLQSLLGLTAASTLTGLHTFADALPKNGVTMPALFVGHGSPMNALEDNIFTKGWRNAVKHIPTPAAILCISAHWETNGTQVCVAEKPKTIHDFGGFAKELFEVQYPTAGSLWLAQETQKALSSSSISTNANWGLDHGAWSVLVHLYPAANIPVVQLSLDHTMSATSHYELAKQLQSLRQKGVLIIGSGNMVHNFSTLQLKGGFENFNEAFAHDWAIEANTIFKKCIAENDILPLLNYKNHSKAFALAVPTPEHYLPMLYTLAIRQAKDKITFFNDVIVGGSFGMTSFMVESS